MPVRILEIASNQVYTAATEFLSYVFSSSESNSKYHMYEPGYISISSFHKVQPIEKKVKNLIKESIDQTILKPSNIQLNQDVFYHVMQYFNAEDLCKMMQVCRSLRQIGLDQDCTLWNNISFRQFQYILRPSNSIEQTCALPQIKIQSMNDRFYAPNDPILSSYSIELAHHRIGYISYLQLLKYQLDCELNHIDSYRIPYIALEQHCREFPNHGIIGLLADICTFEDYRIAHAVSSRRQNALGMVIVNSPKDVQLFRKQTNYVCPLTFVPLHNPHWPDNDLVPVNADGFLGYAFDFIKVLPGYEFLKMTVIKTMFKDILIFKTAQQAEAYQSTSGRNNVYYASLDYVQNDHEQCRSRLCFSTPIREELQHLSLQEREQQITNHLTKVKQALVSTIANSNEK